MKKLAKRRFCRTTGIRIWMLALVFVPACAARADDAPFQLDGSQWESLAHNADDAKRAPISNPTFPSIAEPEPAAPAVAIEAPAAAAPLAVATPSRPIDLPVMPGLNKGFAVQVNSTEEDRSPLPAISESLAATNEIQQPSDKNWAAPTVPKPGEKAADDEENEDKPLNVRMSFLPDSKTVQAPKAEHETTQHLAHLALERGIAAAAAAAAKKPVTPAEKAACAALDAYKKQQLDALQSDRQTLAALQSAITSLGLDKQLSFMTGQGSNTLDAASGENGGMDKPATAIR